MSQSLFLDLGTRTGWAVTSPLPTGRISGAIHFEVGGNTDAERLGRLTVRFIDWLAAFLDEVEADEMVVERVGGSGFQGYAGRVLPGISACALGLASKLDLAVHEVVDGVWKKAVVGYGRPTKQQIMTAVRRLGYVPGSQDEADALGLRHYWLNRAAPTVPLPIDLPMTKRPRRRRPAAVAT